MANWPFSNHPRQIRPFDGDGDAIYEQGSQVYRLGVKMELASDTLKQLASGDDGQQGKAVDELRKKVGDADDKLSLAAELYKPLGSALKIYGDAVRTSIKTDIDTRHDDAQEKWNEYIALPGDKDGRGYFLGIGKPEEGSAEEAEHEAEDRAKAQAWEDWNTAADAYDTSFDTWETAWNTAVSTIEDAFTDDLKDSRWENFKQGFNTFMEIMGWVGLVVGVLALVIGGPIIAAIAAAVAVVVLAGTLLQWAYGDKSGSDVAWAAIDLIPFGKAGSLFKKGSDFLPGLKEVGQEAVKNFNPKTYREGIDAIKEFSSKSGWERWGKGANTSWSDSTVKVLTGKSFDDWNTTLEGMPGSIYEMYHSKVGHWLKIEGWGNKIYNHFSGDDRESLRNQNPVVRAIW